MTCSSGTIFLSTPSARRATKVGGHGLQVRRISIHALREEGDVTRRVPLTLTLYFYPRPPRGGRPKPVCVQRGRRDFYPRPPRGGRPGNHQDVASRISQFLSTPSARRATLVHPFPAVSGFDFYPRPPRGGRLLRFRPPWCRCSISIHALREEGDKPTATYESIAYNFYPRPPRGGRRKSAKYMDGMFKFLSTPSARRATVQTRR